jgi:DNA ligase-1
MVRSLTAPYKYGRSTAKEGGLVKVKRFEDSEALVVGVEERMHNGNEATVDHLGHTKRSTHQANKTGRGDLGALVCILDPHSAINVRFNVGSGFTDAQRAELWAIRDQLPGRIVKFRHFAAAGVVEAPRFPVFIGFRHPDDLG